MFKVFINAHVALAFIVSSQIYIGQDKDNLKTTCQNIRIHEEISKINAEIVQKLGERISVNYIISGERGEKRKINYNLIKEKSY